MLDPSYVDDMQLWAELYVLDFLTKCLERILNYSFFVSIILNYQFTETRIADFYINFVTFFVFIWDFTSISSNFTSFTSNFTSISSFHLHWDNAPTA